MRLLSFFILLIIGMCPAEHARAASIFDVVGCKLYVPDRFVMSFQNDGQLSMVGQKGDGSITVERYAEVNWGNPSTMPQAIYGNYGLLATRTLLATQKQIKVVQVTDKHNVLLFFGGAAESWKDFLRSCEDVQ